jgi:RNAse (barnase) inhibitor barstar
MQIWHDGFMASDDQRRTIILNAIGWTSEEDFYAAFLAEVGAPEWHGHNLDALEESIRDSDINAVNVPYRIVLVGTSQATPDFQQWLCQLEIMIDDLIRANVPIQLEIPN